VDAANVVLMAIMSRDLAADLHTTTPDSKLLPLLMKFPSENHPVSHRKRHPPRPSIDHVFKTVDSESVDVDNFSRSTHTHPQLSRPVEYVYIRTTVTSDTPEDLMRYHLSLSVCMRRMRT